MLYIYVIHISVIYVIYMRERERDIYVRVRMLECSYNCTAVLYLIMPWVEAFRTIAGKTNYKVPDIRFQTGSELCLPNISDLVWGQCLPTGVWTKDDWKVTKMASD